MNLKNDKESTSTKRKPSKKSSSISRSSGISKYDPLDIFLKEIQQYPLLSPEEEKSLAEDYIATGDVNAAARLVTSNLRLVIKIAFEYRRAYRNIMDLIQEGNVGLMHAVKKFDPSKGVKLSSYAAWWIKAYILRFILGNWRLVKLGTTQAQRKLFFNLNKERSRLNAMGIEPTTEMLAERMGVREHEVIEMEKRLQTDDMSLNAEINDGEGKSLTRMDMLHDTKDLQDTVLDNAFFDDEIKQRLDAFSILLKDKEAFIFENRLLHDNPLTLQEIGDKFSVSRERIRQIEKRLLGKLRLYLEEEMPGYFAEEAP